MPPGRARQFNVRRIGIFLLLLAGEAIGSSVTSAGSPNTLSFSPLGAWVVVRQRDATLRVVSTTSRKELALGSDRGEAELSWSQDDRLLAVAQGTLVSLYEIPRGALRSVRTLAGPVTQLSMSNDGKRLAVVSDRRLWVAATDDGSFQAVSPPSSRILLSVLGGSLMTPAIRGEIPASWAPDSSKIVYLATDDAAEIDTQPGGQLPSFTLNVWDARTGNTRTLTQSDSQWTYFFSAQWRPDSQELLFYRMNRLQNTEELCRWDQGQLRIVMAESNPYWINIPDRPVFLDDEHVVVASERTGLNHAYLLQTDGQLLDVTPSGMIVHLLGRDPGDTTAVLVYASDGDHQQHQVVALDINGKPPRPVTSTPGWHEVSLSKTGYVDSFSSASTAPWISVGTKETSSRNGSTLNTSDLPRRTSQQSIPLQIRLHGGSSLPARLYTSAKKQIKRRPILIYLSQGPEGPVAKDAWGGWQMQWNRAMVDQGYAVLAVDLRGTEGYGHSFEEFIHTRLGAQEMVDLREVLDELKRRSDVDTNHIGIWGSGYGAFLTVTAMLDIPTAFMAGYAHGPVVQWRATDHFLTERYLGLPQQNSFSYYESYALKNLRRLAAPLLVVYDQGSEPDASAQKQLFAQAVENMRLKRPGVASHVQLDVTSAGDHTSTSPTGEAEFQAFRSLFAAAVTMSANPEPESSNLHASAPFRRLSRTTQRGLRTLRH